MSEFTTPCKMKKKSSLTIPPSPFLKKLGYGTGVAVYKLDRSPVANNLRSPWALKKLCRGKSSKSLYGKRLLAEAAILKELNHPNIVGFRAFVKGPDGKECLAMEDCNISLGDLIESRNEQQLSMYPAQNIMKVAFDISQALHYLHDIALLLHCDVKSFNVLIKGDFVICKLCDFGVCLPLDKNGNIDKGKAGSNVEYVGTPIWTAPEISEDDQQTITAKSDIYSYGLVLWEMLALIPPFLPGDDTIDDIASLNDSFNNSLSYIKKTTWRPELPAVEFTDDYNYILELFYFCTMQEPCGRPTSSNLALITKEMILNLEWNHLL